MIYSIKIKDILFLALILGFVVGALLLAAFWFSRPDVAEGAAPPGIPARLATSSTQVVGEDNEAILFSTTTPFCSGRAITTATSSIMISFGGPSFNESSYSTSGPATGHLQAASTTEYYDASKWGCGLWRAHGHNASSTINISQWE